MAEKAAMTEQSAILEGPGPAATPGGHIVDVLIAERAPRLSRTPLWPLLRPLLYSLLDYDKARWFADTVGPLEGRETLELVSQMMGLEVVARGLERVPRHGRAVLVCNHPTSVTDGLAVWDAVKAVRPDLTFYINADAMRVIPRFDTVAIPVEWMAQKKTREHLRSTVRRTRSVMEAEGALMIFPAGQLAEKVRGGGTADMPWAPGAFTVARNFAAPVVPMHLAGPQSRLFHFFNGFSEELRDVTLFHEMLNKAGGAFRLTVGPPIPPGALPADSLAAAAALKHYVETVLPVEPDRPFAAG
jgi:putative hemolysin